MESLRWILLLAGLVLIAAIYWTGQRRERARDEGRVERARRGPDPDARSLDAVHRREPDLDLSGFEPDDPVAEPGARAAPSRRRHEAPTSGWPDPVPAPAAGATAEPDPAPRDSERGDASSEQCPGESRPDTAAGRRSPSAGRRSPFPSARADPAAAAEREQPDPDPAPEPLVPERAPESPRPGAERSPDTPPPEPARPVPAPGSGVSDRRPDRRPDAGTEGSGIQRGEGERVMVLYVVAARGQRLVGSQLREALERQQLRHRESGIFEARDAEGATVFSVANVVEPGTFDLATMDTMTTPGVALFMRVIGPRSAETAFDRMLDTARALTEEFGGRLLDAQPSPLTRQMEQHMREELREFDRKRRARTP